MENPFQRFIGSQQKERQLQQMDKFVEGQKEERDEKFKVFESSHPEEAKIFEELKNPNLAKDDLFARVTEWNQAQTTPLEGIYEEISSVVNEHRTVKVKYFKNGRVTFGVSDDSE